MEPFISGWKPETNREAFPKFTDKFATGLRKVAAAMGPASIHIIPELTPISDQRRWGSCVCNATLDTCETLIGLRDPSKVTQLSRMALWWTCRRREGTEDANEGIYMSTAFSVMEDEGVCPEDVWGYTDDHAYRGPKLAALEIASDNRISGWSRIFEVSEALGDATELSILADHPVVFGTAVGRPFKEYDGSSVVLYPPENPDDILGRHAIAVFGVRRVNGKREYYIRNSWGCWGIDGYAWISESFLTWGEAGNHSVLTYCPDIIC